MSDTLTNALSQSAHSQSVLAGIQNPAVVNPLAGMGSAITAVSGMQGLQEKQAQQLAGQAYQGAINQETGEFDPNKFRTLLAQSGSGAAMAAGAALLNTQNISSDQLKQNLSKANWLNAASGAALQSGDFSDAGMMRLFQSGMASGLFTLPEVQKQIAMLPPDAAGRRQWLLNHQNTSASFAEQLQRQFGTRETWNTPQGTYNTQIPSPAANAPTIVAPHGTAPGDVTTSQVLVDDQGIIPLDVNGRPTRPNGRYQSMPVPTATVPGVPQGGPPRAVPAPNAPAAIPAPPQHTVIIQNGRIVTQPAAPAAPAAPSGGNPATSGTPGGSGTYPGPGFGVLPGPGASLSNGGVNVASADPSFAPGVGAAAPPSPAVAGDVNAILAGINQARVTPQGGTQQAFNAIQSGAVATSPAPAPAAVVPAPVAAARPPVFTSAPQGQPEEIAADQKQFIADRTALPQRQTQEQNLRHAYDALKLITTGKGTENASALRNLLTTVGLAPPAMANDEAIYEYGRKYLERTIAEAGNAGGTDTARALAAQSNPNVSLVNPANLAFLRNDIGKVRQQMAAYMTAPDTTIGKGYGKHSADTASNTDYRGFNWDDYSGPEQKQIMKDVGAEGTKAHDALARAIGMGRAFWPAKGGGPMIPHAATAPMPPPNALAMAQPQSNPLLAA